MSEAVRTSVFVLALLAARMCAAQPALQPMPLPGESCAPVEGLSFVCGPRRPEDAIAIPETRWLLVGGLAPGSGLGVVDMDAKVAFFLYNRDTPKRRDRRYPGCAAAPDPATFAVRGLSLRATARGRYLLYAVAHGPIEGVQVFTLDARGDAPSIVWRGCVAMADNRRANSVASFADGTLLATVIGGLTYENGGAGGAVFAWSPGESVLHWLPGTELPSPNGIETSRDGSEFYVLSTNDQSFHVFSRDGQELRTTRTPGFNPDNIRWNGDRLIAAGSIYDEPACGGLITYGEAPNAECNRGYMVAEIDPASLHWTMVAYAEPNPAFEAIASGIVAGDTLWLTTWKSDRIAYRPLPRPPTR